MARSRISHISSLFLAFASLLSLVAADAVDFHYYPTAAQDCLYKASNSSHCDPSSVPKYNSCVCSNGGGFLDSAASCLGQSDSGDLNSVYSTMSRNCGDSNTPIAFDLQKWMSAAGQGSSSSSGGSKTTTTAAPSSTKLSTIVVTASATTPVVSTITLASSAGASSAEVSVVTVTPGQATVVTVAAPAGTDSSGGSSGSSGSSSSSGSSGSSGQDNSGGSNSNKLSTGAIAGIAVGGAGAAAAVGGFLVWLLLRRRNRPSTGGNVAESQAPPSYGGPVPYGGAGGAAVEAKPEHQSFISNSTTPEPMKYTYANQQTGGQPMYGQPNPGYSPQPQYAQPQYTQPAYNVPPPQQGVMELQGAQVQRPMELPAGHY